MLFTLMAPHPWCIRQPCSLASLDSGGWLFQQQQQSELMRGIRSAGACRGVGSERM